MRVYKVCLEKFVHLLIQMYLNYKWSTKYYYTHNRKVFFLLLPRKSQPALDIKCLGPAWNYLIPRLLKYKFPLKVVVYNNLFYIMRKWQGSLVRVWPMVWKIDFMIIWTEIHSIWKQQEF